MIRSFILISLMILSNLVFGQSKVFKGKPVPKSTEYNQLDKLISSYDIYEIDATTMHQYFVNNGNYNTVTLELGDKYTFDLNLIENHIFKQGIQVKYATENGVVPGKLTTIKCYTGNVKGTSKPVALSVNKGLVSGFISLDNDDLFFEPLRFVVPGSPENYFIFYHAKDFHETKEFKCLAKEVSNSVKDINNNPKFQPEFVPNACKEVEIGEASDKSMCTKYGDIDAVQDHITTVINAVQANYNGSFNDDLTLIISDWFNVTCSGSDPWTSSTDPEVLLNSFTSWGPTHFATHDIGQLFSNRDFDGGTVGIAWVEEVCTPFKYSCIQDWTSNINLMRCTVAHEIGHNFSCDHDAPNSGFIMAPAVSNTNTWSAASIAAFNAYVPTRACLTGCAGGGSAPVAEFTSNKVEGCKPLTVSFFDQSTNNPTSWVWSFPGGTPASSTAKNPVVIYNTAGVYNVSLTASNSFGIDAITKTNYITVKDKPTANFTYVKNQGSVQFTNTSIGGTSFSWNFGDGDFSTEENPLHEYTDPGSYTVTLIVSNECGTNTKVLLIDLTFIPQADFSSDITEGCIPFTVHFSDESTYFPTSWLWTFPGGNPATSTQKNPIVTYTIEGEYKVTLTATNIAGSNTIMIDKYIKAKDKPVANFTSVVNGHTVNFTNTTPGTGLSFIWDFGDSETSTQANPVHVYDKAGDYSVMLTVTNACGTNSISKSVTILEGPKANFNANITSGCTPFSVQFTDVSTHAPTSWHWIFPGGTPSSSTQQNPLVQYNNAGQYDVTLIVTNAIGSDTLSISHFINALTSPVAAFSSNINGNTVSFNNSSSYGISYLWNFGDNMTSTQANPVHTYSTEGTFTVQLTVTNPCGVSIITHTVEIVFPPTAGFSADKTTGCEPLTVQFNNSSSPNATSFNWSFPGGTPSSSTQMNPLVNYNAAGIYPVTLIAINNGGSDTLVINNFITVLAKPVNSFSYVNNNHITSFTNTSTGGTSWHWEFGDGNSSNVKDPTHIYQSPGNYTVKLTVTNQCGTTELTQQITVVFSPEANFSSNLKTGCNNLTVTFSDLSNPGATSWNWTFPGGNPGSSTLQNPTVVYNSVGSYDVQLIATNSGGSDTINKPGFILVSSAPPVSDFSYSNVGLSYNFNNESTDAYNYKWLFGDGQISLENDPLHTYQDGGTYNVTLIAFNGCGSDTVVTQVNVVGAPPVGEFGSNINSGCLPLTIEFHDSSLGGAKTWEWSFPGGDPSSSNLQNPVVIYNSAGSYEVNLIVSNSFGSDTITKTAFINVGDVPVGKFSYLSVGTAVKFTNLSTGASTFLWNFGDGLTSTEENPNHSYATPGLYTVTLTVANECGSFVFTQQVDVKTSVNEIDFIESMNIYPNPNNAHFTIALNSKKQTEIVLTILDVIGREVYKSNLQLSEGFNSKNIEMDNASAGQYILVFKSDGSRAIQKITVQ